MIDADHAQHMLDESERLMRLMPEIELDDPLLSLFVAQHNFRERYLHALQEILAIALDTSLNIEVAFEQMAALAEDALNEDMIKSWVEDGMPIPWIDGMYEPAASQIDQMAHDAREDFLRRIGQ